MAQSRLDEARKFLLTNLIETYFKLSAGQEQAFRRLISKEEFREVRQMQLTWADRMREKYKKEGLEEGREEGRQEGVVEGKREALLRQLETKFGRLPDEVKSRVRAMKSVVELDACLDRVLTATSLDEMKLCAEKLRLASYL